MTFIDLPEEVQLSVNNSLEERSYVILYINKFVW